ncbi:MAG TPA: hypothetical protein DC049_08040 [Spirochaetia bacterium]|nr:hypothetical protein [Spirochaetia bacterium]
MDYEIAIDLFAGGGGVSEGARRAGIIFYLAVNHDIEAIRMHMANHPETIHLVDDVFRTNPFEATKGLDVGWLHASPDCTHFSVAKGGKPVKKEIRSLAWVVVHWAQTVRPRIITLENVKEFQTWGPLTKENKPDKRKLGATFNLWRSQLENLGYKVEFKELSAADYGAPTIRKRLFMIARCDGQPIVWPKPTHGPAGSGLRPVRRAFMILISLPVQNRTRLQKSETASHLMLSKLSQKRTLNSGESKMSKSDKSKGGYFEWGSPLSIQRGCNNGCLYCYARWNACHRHKLCTEVEWNERPMVDLKAVDKKKYRKLPDDKQPIMFPATHDITINNINECMVVLKKLLDKGNRVVIVSKPHWNVVPFMAEALLDYKEQIIFRFTIGSIDDATLKFWEPNAAGFEERLRCLQYCFCKGYKTSVSCEPLLDRLTTHVYEGVKEFVNESFWIGILKNFNSRVDKTEISIIDHERFVRPMLAASTPGAVRAIFNLMKDKPLVRWKDSIRKIVFWDMVAND